MIPKCSTGSDHFDQSQSSLKPEDSIVFDSASQKEFEIICKNQDGDHDSSDLQLEIVYTDEIYRKIVEILSREKNVQHIFLMRDLITFLVWTSLGNIEKKSRRALYERELELMRLFSPVGYHFDFHIAYEQDTQELLGSGVKILFSRK